MTTTTLVKTHAFVIGEEHFAVTISTANLAARFKLYQSDYVTQPIGASAEDPPVPFFWREGASGNGNCTRDITEARVQVEGYVRWDGCFDLRYNADHAYHGCYPDEALALALAIRHAIRLCHDVIDSDECIDTFDLANALTKLQFT